MGVIRCRRAKCDRRFENGGVAAHTRQVFLGSAPARGLKPALRWIVSPRRSRCVVFVSIEISFFTYDTCCTTR